METLPPPSSSPSGGPETLPPRAGGPETSPPRAGGLETLPPPSSIPSGNQGGSIRPGICAGCGIPAGCGTPQKAYTLSLSST
eukprot:1157610-Prorocentrum_minimum.AAC.1